MKFVEVPINMPLNDHNNIELAHRHKGACPLCGGFRQKEAAPITEAASSKPIY